ncbi:hypothetical protein RhiirA4_420225 [Rhizophagus irregularis]|uniref:Uncharacterized protein n=1 Tax=Rhizophagus irregularis TaxID=588596 RepID=A0A2I1GH06_9GLOM|nr:hypothetical protein RhiirA4_420225 [Rhizophagus irregularis]
MHQVFRLLFRGKVALIAEADPTAFNDPYDDTYRDTSKDRGEQKIILRSSTGISYESSGNSGEASSVVSIQFVMFKKVLVPWVQKKSKVTNKIYLVAKVGRYVVGIVIKVSSLDKPIDHQQIRGNYPVPSSVNKLIEYQQTGETSVPSVNKIIDYQQTGETSVPSVNKLIQHQQAREKSVFCKEIINTPICQKYGHSRVYSSETEMLWALFVKLFHYEKAHFGSKFTYKSLASDINKIGFKTTRQTLSNFYRHVTVPHSRTKEAILAWINKKLCDHYFV